MPFTGSDGKQHLTFNEATRQATIGLQPITYNPNSTFPIQVTQVGFLAAIYLPFSITFTTPATGTITNYDPIQANAGVAGNDVPTPWNVINNITLQSNEGSQLWSTSGYGAYLKNTVGRTNHDITNPIAAYNSTLSNALIFSRPSSYTTSTTYTINFFIKVEVSLTQANNAGLVLIQNPTSRLQLSVTWANIATNLLNCSAGPLTNVSVTCNPTQLFYNLPDDPASYPDLSYSYITIEDYITQLTNPQDIYRPSIGNAYLETIIQYINNGVAVPPAQFGNIQMIYQATQQPYNTTAASQLYMQQERRGGMSLPDGVIWWDFIYGSGLPELYNPRDVVQTSQLTDFQLITQFTGNPTGTNYKRCVRSMLAKV